MSHSIPAYTTNIRRPFDTTLKVKRDSRMGAVEGAAAAAADVVAAQDRATTLTMVTTTDHPHGVLSGVAVEEPLEEGTHAGEAAPRQQRRLDRLEAQPSADGGEEAQ